MRACSTFKHFPRWNFAQNVYFIGNYDFWGDYVGKYVTSKNRSLQALFTYTLYNMVPRIAFFFITQSLAPLLINTLINKKITTQWSLKPVSLNRFSDFKFLALSIPRHKTKNSKQIFPEKDLRDHSPNSYIHVSVSDLCIYSHNRSAYCAAGIYVWGPIVGINSTV